MSKKKEVIKFSLQLLAIVAVTTVTFTKIIIPVRVDGQSMYPTLHDEDIAIVNALSLERYLVILLFIEMINYILMEHTMMKST